jgi:hypothetical protein
MENAKKSMFSSVAGNFIDDNSENGREKKPERRDSTAVSKMNTRREGC